MEMRYRLPGKERPRVEIVEGCTRLLDGFSGVWKKHPEAEIISFNGHEIKQKA